MSRSRKDGKRRGAHGVISGTFLCDGFGAHDTGQPKGRREPMMPHTKRAVKKATSRGRRRKNKKVVLEELSKELN